MGHDDWLFIDLYTPDLDWVEGGLDVRNGERYNFFCCTQAMLFRSDMLPGIIRYWRTHASEPVDDNLRNYRQEFSKQIYLCHATQPLRARRSVLIQLPEEHRCRGAPE